MVTFYFLFREEKYFSSEKPIWNQSDVTYITNSISWKNKNFSFSLSQKKKTNRYSRNICDSETSLLPFCDPPCSTPFSQLKSSSAEIDRTKIVRHFSSHLLPLHLNPLAYSKIESQKNIYFVLPLLLLLFHFSSDLIDPHQSYVFIVVRLQLISGLLIIVVFFFFPPLEFVSRAHLGHHPPSVVSSL